MKCQQCPVRAAIACLGEVTPPLCRRVAEGQPGRAEQLVALAEGNPRAATPRPGPSPDGRVRLGLFAPCLHQGGAEAWMLLLALSVDPGKVACVGLTVTATEADADPAMVARFRELMPVSFGREAARERAGQADVIVSWAVADLPELVGNSGARVVSVSHSTLESPWGVDHNARASRVDRWVAVSELALTAIPATARAEIPTSVIWNAVDVARLEVRRSREAMRSLWSVPPGAKVAGYLGRLSAEKDPHAMRRLVDHLDGEWHVVLVGAGAEAVQPHPRLHLVGNDPRAGDCLNAFDVLVVPSHYESFGLTIAEGLWFGLPVVTTPVGLAKIRPGLTLEVPVNADGRTLARAVLGAYLGGAMQSSREWAREHLGPDRFGREWTDLICSTAPNPTPRPAVDPMIRDAVNACQHRGPEGGLKLLEEELRCCGSGDERTACAAGKGKRPGRVTLRECISCKSV